ncbi:rubredoxin [Pyrococcus kukulkanii]|uniref:rubredoxin n=1 Tax=Pyrococcus kukulkanii TaxID=1609559 RepID=UPI000F13C136|nr:MAG: rubredoxin [Thermococci archaeon]
MAKWRCKICGYIYDEDEGGEENGIASGTKFEDLPRDWLCPLCGAPKDEFEKIE